MENQSYKGSKMDILYYDDSACALNEDCEVRICGDEIVVSYEGYNGPEVWSGKGKDGHYELRIVNGKGRASLHRFSANNSIVEGYWIEDGNQGMWRIRLKKNKVI